MCVIQVMRQLTVLEEEVHGEVPVGDHRPKGAGQLNYKMCTTRYDDLENTIEGLFHIQLVP